MSKTYVVLDFETTGLDAMKDQIIEVGAVKLDENMKQLAVFSEKVRLNEGVTLPEFITNLTGITAVDLQGKRSEKEVLADLKKFIGDSSLVAHSAPFELAFLGRGNIKVQEFYCTRFMATVSDPHENPGLKYLAERCGVSLDNHHTALADATATADIFRLMAEELEDDLPIYANKVMDELERRAGKLPKNAEAIPFVQLRLSQAELVELTQLTHSNKRLSNVFLGAWKKTLSLGKPE